jgi:cytochrome c oxidase subunit 3
MQKTAKPMLWFGILSIIMIFGSLTSAVIVRKGAGDWWEFSLPNIFYISTGVILFSSVTYSLALQAAKDDKTKQIFIYSLLTFILGITFTILQVIGWKKLTEEGIFFTGPESNVAGSFFFVLSGLHLAHIIGALLSVLYVTIKSYFGKYSSKNYLGLQISVIFWHFLDALWIYLLIFLMYIV